MTYFRPYQVVTLRDGFMRHQWFRFLEDAEKYFDAEVRDIGGPVELRHCDGTGDYWGITLLRQSHAEELPRGGRNR